MWLLAAALAAALAADPTDREAMATKAAPSAGPARSVELALCAAAEAGDLAGVEGALARGARLDGHRERLSGRDALVFGAATALTGGAFAVAYALSDGRSDDTRALACALRARPMRRPIVEAVLAAGPPPGPKEVWPLGVWLDVHTDDPDALDDYLWLRTKGFVRPRAMEPYLRERGGELSPLWRHLLDTGADIHPCDAARAGDLPVMRAVATDAVVCVDPDLPMRPATLFDLAVRNDRETVATWFLERGVDPSRPAPPNRSSSSAFPPVPPLSYALRSGSPEMVARLLRAGADPTGRDGDGSTFLERLLTRPELLPAALSALPASRAVPYAVRLVGHPTPEVAAAAEAWMPPRLRAIAAREDVRELSLAVWGEALAEAPLDGVLDVLEAPRGARAGALAGEANACLPWPGEGRREVRRALPRWRRVEGLAVVFDSGSVVEVRITDAAAVRAAGCDAPLLRAAEVPRWQAEWEYGLGAGGPVRREGAAVVVR